MSDSVWPHRRQPTGLPHPWDSPGKNTGVGCHFLLQCMKVKSESEVAQSCPTLSDHVNCSLPGSSVHGIFQARVLEWVAIAFSQKSPQRWLILLVFRAWQEMQLNTSVCQAPGTWGMPHSRNLSIDILGLISVTTFWASFCLSNCIPVQSVHLSHSVMSNSLWPHGLQHTRLPCPSTISWS